MTPAKWNWFIESSSEHHGTMYAIKNYLFSGETPFQKVDIIDTYTYGRLLVIEGKAQSAELDECIYHEALVHPAAVMHGKPRRVLIMGGGEGATLREVCRYQDMESIVMVDIDEQVVQMCREHLPGWHRGSFEDARVELLHMDARRYLEETDQKFDIIYSDLSESVEEGPSRMLFTREFYSMVKTKLNPGGILAVQSGDFSLQYINVHAAIRNTISSCFEAVASYHTFVPSFNCAWSYVIACEDRGMLRIDSDEIDRRIEKTADQLEFYDGETHIGMFCLPKNARKAIRDEKSIIEDSKPLAL